MYRRNNINKKKKKKPNEKHQNTFVNYFQLLIEIPGKPGVPKITDWDVDRVDLTWTEPKHDGGAPITGYIIEKKEKLSTVWEEVLTTKVHRKSRPYKSVYIFLIITFILDAGLSIDRKKS